MTVGARSALFLPYAELGLIVVDEEHDPAYKQEDGVHYHARDMAVVRASVAEIPVVLASATPVGRNRGERATLRAIGGCICRSASAARICRTIEAIDLRREGPPRGRFIAPRLAEAVKTALERGEQALLFLNRRGYAPLTLCRALRSSLRLPELRRLAGRSPLQAAARLPPLRLLDAAAGAVSRSARRPRASSRCGPGVERLEEEVAALFPDARAGALQRSRSPRSSACARSWPRSSRALVDIVIGTQLVAEGPPFSQAQSRRHRRRRSRPCATAIRAPPSARFSSCTRWSAAPGARKAAASAICRPTSPSIR